MAVFVDPRARALFPNGENPTEFTLHGWDGKVIASATCYGAWWGVSSHASRIPVAMRATSAREARELLMNTVWLFRPNMEHDEFAHCAEDAKRGVLYIRSLLDEEVREAARDNGSPAWGRISGFIGDGADPAWITARCVDEVYLRDEMDPDGPGWNDR